MIFYIVVYVETKQNHQNLSGMEPQAVKIKMPILITVFNSWSIYLNSFESEFEIVYKRS